HRGPPFPLPDGELPLRIISLHRGPEPQRRRWAALGISPTSVTGGNQQVMQQITVCWLNSAVLFEEFLRHHAVYHLHAVPVRAAASLSRLIVVKCKRTRKQSALHRGSQPAGPCGSESHSIRGGGL